jgi:type VI secretion system secreted protein Hcp
MALKFRVTIEGSKTRFAAEQTRPDRLEGLAFQYGVSVPYDPATGTATGQRQHGTIAMTKAWGAASPQLFQALINNERLNSVRFEFYRRDPGGVESLFHRITLESAFVAGINQHVEPTYAPATANYPELEEITFVFGKITIENISGATTATDEWGVTQ